MNVHQVIRAWKDPAYRARLTAAERAAMPAHPAGLVELSDDDIVAVSGAAVKPTKNWACTLPTLVCREPGC